MSGRFCGECGANVLQVGQQVLHPQLDVAYVLCGNTGKRTLTYATMGEQQEQATGDDRDQRIVDTRSALNELWDALNYHESTQNAPCEVRAEQGWVDVMDLVVKAREALD